MARPYAISRPSDDRLQFHADLLQDDATSRVQFPRRLPEAYTGERAGVRAMSPFTAATFLPLVGDSFRLTRDGGPPLDLVLVEVTPGPSSFSIVFVGPATQRLAQRTYRVEHERLGAFDLFLVPIGITEAGLRYEAVFG